MAIARSHILTAGLGALILAAAGAGIASAATPPSTAQPGTGTSSTASRAAVLNTAATLAPVEPVASTASADQGCTTGVLPARVIGDPAVKAGQAAGVRVWHDATGWHVRSTHPGSGTVIFTGTIRSARAITAQGYHLESRDIVRLSKDRRTLTFRFVNHGNLDGIDFTDQCAPNTTFTIKRAGHKMKTTALFLGAQGAHPAHDPFTIRRHRL